MNRIDSKEVAKTISNEDLSIMFNNAKASVKDWRKRSLVNKSMTIGVSWNILAKDFNINHVYNMLIKTNMIRDFGEFLPNTIKKHKYKKDEREPYHENPKF